ncbi:MAG TPA: GNAT family N-acetyltransferase [Miltoncostaeaceae bacterium]|nr:GNAT family N-acetyltransferase [Miltoncostaeaceae bacterium]
MTDTIEIRVEPPETAEARRLLEALEREKVERVEDWDLDNAVRVASEELMPPHGAFLMAMHGGRAVGCGAVRRLGPDVAELKRLYVDPDARGLHLGERLMEAMEDAARASGYRTVRLDTDPCLEEAQGLFARRGYRQIPPYNDNPNASAWWEKDL